MIVDGRIQSASISAECSFTDGQKGLMRIVLREI
jgi:hypothetical protein